MHNPSYSGILPPSPCPWLLQTQLTAKQSRPPAEPALDGHLSQASFPEKDLSDLSMWKEPPLEMLARYPAPTSRLSAACGLDALGMER